MQKKKIVKVLIGIIVPIILLTLGFNIYHWHHYSNKNNLIEKYLVDNTKEIYIIGTIGKNHFNRINNYSMEDLISVIENISPDAVLITARDDHYRNYNIIDGDIDTCVAYSYCLNKDIPVKMVDWWIIDNSYPDSVSTDLRDDNIFIKISRTLREISQKTKILVIVDSHNFYEQIARFKISGYKKEPLGKNEIKSYFISNTKDFKFPQLSSKIWKDRTYFYSYIFPRLIKENDGLFDSVKKQIIDTNHDKFYRDQIKYCKYLNNNILFK